MSIAESTVRGFLDELASSSATPGGGAAAGVVAATGAGLISMVARLTIGKEGFEDLTERMEAMVAAADSAREKFLELADLDASAFDGVMAAFKLPKDTEQERAARLAAIQAGYVDAATVPREVARAAVDLMELAEDATAMGNPQAASDGRSAAACLYAAALSAIANVVINASALRDEAVRSSMIAETDELRARADRLLDESQTAFRLRL